MPWFYFLDAENAHAPGDENQIFKRNCREASFYFARHKAHESTFFMQRDDGKIYKYKVIDRFFLGLASAKNLNKRFYPVGFGLNYARL